MHKNNRIFKLTFGHWEYRYWQYVRIQCQTLTLFVSNIRFARFNKKGKSCQRNDVQNLKNTIQKANDVDTKSRHSPTFWRLFLYLLTNAVNFSFYSWLWSCSGLPLIDLCEPNEFFQHKIENALSSTKATGRTTKLDNMTILAENRRFSKYNKSDINAIMVSFP